MSDGTDERVQLDDLVVPHALDDSPEARDFTAAFEAVEAAETGAIGSADLLHQVDEVLAAWQHEAARRRGIVARLGGRIVGLGTMEWRTEGEAAAESWQSVAVHPVAESRGVGRALADRLEELARADGRRRIIARVNSVASSADRLKALSGWGAVPSDSREVRFLVAREFVLEQITRMSRLPLPVDPERLEAHLAHAKERARDDYRLVYWVDRAPTERREDYAVLIGRLGEDMPLAGVPLPDLGDSRPWTVERVLEAEDAMAASPTDNLIVAAEHIASGQLAGFTTLTVPAERDRPVSQGPTVVMSEHRGHRLGLWLKVANIQNLEATYPGHPAIVTGNAEENRHMLDVNEALGFEPIAAQGAWTKQL